MKMNAYKHKAQRMIVTWHSCPKNLKVGKQGSPTVKYDRFSVVQNS